MRIGTVSVPQILWTLRILVELHVVYYAPSLLF